MKKKLASAISIFITVLPGVAQNFDNFKMHFKNCNEAFEYACQDVKNDSIRYFSALAGSHKTSDWEKKDLQIDSVLLSNYNINVIRTGNFDWDFTVRCYSKFIRIHMDSTYDHNFYFRSYNIVQRLNGETDTIQEE